MKSNADISLPPEADLPKSPWERPSWVPLYLYLGCVIALALVAIALDASGGGAVTAAVGIALALASLLFLVSGFAVGTYIVRRFVSHTPDSFHAADPQEKPLGAMLSCPMEQFPMTAFAKLLSDEQKQQQGRQHRPDKRPGRKFRLRQKVAHIGSVRQSEKQHLRNEQPLGARRIADGR